MVVISSHKAEYKLSGGNKRPATFFLSGCLLLTTGELFDTSGFHHTSRFKSFVNMQQQEPYIEYPIVDAGSIAAIHDSE